METCVYCGKELIYLWEKRRFDCDQCHHAIHITHYEDHAFDQVEDNNNP